MVTARSHGNSYIFYKVANSYDLTRRNSYDFCKIVCIIRVANLYEFVRNMTYT